MTMVERSTFIQLNQFYIQAFLIWKEFNHYKEEYLWEFILHEIAVKAYFSSKIVRILFTEDQNSWNKPQN